MTEAHVSVIVLLLVMVCYVTEIVPIAVTAMGSCALLAILRIAPASAVWSGLSNDVTLVVGGMVVVGTAVIESGAARNVGTFVVKRAKGDYRKAAILLIVITILISGFINNSATVATVMPIMLGVIVASKGQLHEKHWLLPLAIATNASGMLTLIGTTSQMIGQNVLQEHGLPLFRFFDFAWIGVPMCIAFMLYFLLFGKRLARWIWGENPPHTEAVREMMARAESGEEERERATGSRSRQFLSVFALVAAVTFMVIPNPISNGTVAMAAAVFVLVTRCISLKKLYKKFDWTTMFVLAGGIGFATGIERSGGSMLIANWIAGLFGEQITPMQVFVMFVVTAAILTPFMSNTAVAAMLVPIVISFHAIVDFNLYPVLMGMCLATNADFATPIGTPSMTMVFGPGEYRFTDFIRYGLPFSVIGVIIILIVTPLVWPLV